MNTPRKPDKVRYLQKRKWQLRPCSPRLHSWKWGQSLPAGLRGKAAPTSYSRGPRKGVGDQGGPASILQGEARRARG